MKTVEKTKYSVGPISIAMDSGSNFLGFSIYDITSKKYIISGLLRPTTRDGKIIPVGDSYPHIKKCRSLLKQIKELVKKYEVTTGIIEVPSHWAKAGFAARESGSMQKLNFVAGMICSISMFKTCYPEDWKGNMSKEICKARLEKFHPNIDTRNMSSDEIDSICINHWFLNMKV